RRSVLLRMADLPRDSRTVADLRACGFTIEHEIASDGDKNSGKTIDELIASVRGSDVEEIFLVADLRRWDEVQRFVQQLYVLPIPVTVIPDAATATLFQRPVRQYGLTVGVEFQRPPLSVLERFWKRLLDLAFAFAGLVVFIPMFTIVAIAIKLDSPGP